jgi:SAM-dependent methyltransferase
MLSICRNKLQVPLYQGDAKGFNIDRKFNVIIMMNAVLGYQSTNDDVKSTIANIKQHLLPGGLFIFDVWNGHSVLQERPTERVKQYSVGNASIVRVVRPRLALDKNLCTCEYTWYTHTSDSLTIRSENHRVRYFFNLELEAHLAYHGYKVLEARKPQRCINAPLAWHKLYVAQL